MNGENILRQGRRPGVHSDSEQISMEHSNRGWRYEGEHFIAPVIYHDVFFHLLHDVFSDLGETILTHVYLIERIRLGK